LQSLTDSKGKRKSSFCEQKEAKKLRQLGWRKISQFNAPSQINKSFLLLFFKKEDLLLLRYLPGHQARE